MRQSGESCDEVEHELVKERESKTRLGEQQTIDRVREYQTRKLALRGRDIDMGASERARSSFGSTNQRMGKTLKILAILVSFSFLLVGVQTAVAKYAADVEREEIPKFPTFESPPEITPEATVDYESPAHSPEGVVDFLGYPDQPSDKQMKSQPGAEVTTISDNVKFFDTPDSYVYDTAYGIYVFNKESVHTMRIVDPGPGTLARSSFSVVRGEEYLEELNSVALAAEDHFFEYKVDVYHQGEYQGILRTSVHFSDMEKPKIDIAFEMVQDCTLANFHIQWNVVPTFKELKIGNQILDLRDLTRSTLLVAPEYAVEIGDLSVGDEGGPNVIVDWSDAAQGVPYAGPINSPSGSQGMGLQIRFPENVEKVDPSIVVQRPSLDVPFASQRRTFYFNQRYWAFYNDGDTIYYTNTHDANSWDDEFVAVHAGFVLEFDMAQRGSAVAIAWETDNEYYVFFRKGTIVENTIEWGPVAEIYETEDYYCTVGSFVSVAIDPGNLFWVSFTWWAASSENCNNVDQTWIVVYTSGDGEDFGMDFWWPEYYVVLVTVELVPLTKRPMALLHSFQGEDEIYWVYREWVLQNPSTGGWGPIVGEDINLYVWNQFDSLSATASYDDVIHIFYRTNNGQIGYARIEDLSCEYVTFGPYLNIDHPTVTVDPTGYVHAFWLSGPTGHSRDVRYMRQIPNPPGIDPVDVDSWFDPVIPFDLPTGVYYGLTSPETCTDKLFFMWKESVDKLVFSSFPIANNQASSIAPPWASRGLSPYQQYFSSRGENVVVGTGQLVVLETDTTLPGRIIDLSISRIYNPRRIFADSPTFVPSFYDESPYSVGTHWNMDFPWIGETYLHLHNGQQYIPVWLDNVFENHAGEHFKLEREVNPSGSVTGYTLYMKDGYVYDFNANGDIESVVDTTGFNTIAFIYELYGGKERIQKITDTLGRDAIFSYVGDKLETVSYRGRVVKYEYNGDLLWKSILDPGTGHLEITTSYEYSGNDQLYRIIYPTGAISTYTYGQYLVGTDMWTYRVTLHTVGGVLEYTTYYYEQTDGNVRYVSVSNYNNDARYKTTVYRFESLDGSSTMTVYDWSTATQMGPLLQRTKTFYSLQGGGPAKRDVYLGQSEEVSYSEYYAYDDWGNLIYSRNSLGHESFASFSNTKKENAFFGAGRLDINNDEGVFYDSFDERTISDEWEILGNVELDYGTFSLSAPSIHLDQADDVSRFFDMGSETEITFEFAIKVGDMYGSDGEITIYDSNRNYRLIVLLRNDHTVMWTINGFIHHYIMDYYERRWYRMAIAIDMNTQKFDFWADGEKKISDQTLRWTPNNDVAGIGFKAYFQDIWLDEVNVYTGNQLTILDLEVGQRVDIYSGSGKLLCSRQVIFSIWWLTWIPTTMIDVIVVIYGLDGTIEYISPERLRWPKSFTYEKPFAYSPLVRTESGFREKRDPGDAWVDDSLPPGAREDPAGDDWTNAWVENLAASKSKSHCVSPGLDVHWHGFLFAWDPINANPEDYFIQYVWYPSYAFPNHIYLTFHDTTGNWDGAVFWTKTQEGITHGLIPEDTNQWQLFIVNADDVNWDGRVIDGARYYLRDGMACFDFTDIGDQHTGSIFINGKEPGDLPNGDTVMLFSEDGSLVGEGSATSNQAEIKLYEDYDITTFPIRGYFEVWNGFRKYRSHLFEKIWGGDEFEYSPSLFPENEIPDYIHDRLLGTLEYQNGPSPSPPEQPVQMLTMNYYDSIGQLRVMYTGHDDDWLYTGLNYDMYGNLIEIVFPEPGHKTNYFYSSTYNYAYLTLKKRYVDGEEIAESYTYYYEPGVVETGELESVTNPRGYKTYYHYDSLGRTTQIDHAPIPGGPSTRYEYHDDENHVLVFNENDHPLRQTYDGLGRLKYVERMYPGNPPDTVYSRTEYEYDWLGNIELYRTETLVEYEFEYDTLGRKTKTINPDDSFTTTEYDDQNGFVTAIDEEGYKTLYESDFGGRLVSVRDYGNIMGGFYYETNYEYDEVDNLREVIFNIDRWGNVIQETIEYAHDDLNRLVQTTYPDDSPPTSESWEYDNIGNIVSHTDREGYTVEFVYDEASQLKEIQYPEPYYLQTYTYDENGNVESILKLEGSSYFHLYYGYDERDRPTSQYFSNNGGSVGFGGFTYFQYDDAGNLINMIYPEGGYQLTYTYDDFDRPVQVGTIAQLTYDVDDAILEMDYSNGVTTSLSYDSMRRVERIHVYDDSIPPQEYLDLNYQYYDNGDVDSITSPSFTEEFQYEFLGRLWQYERTGDVHKLVQYSYDNLGNRMLFNDWDQGNYYYEYGPYNRIDRFYRFPITNREVFFQYDKNGNLVSKEVHVQGYDTEYWDYIWGYDNSLREVQRDGETLSKYYYDGLGRRVISEEGSPVVSAKAYVFVQCNAIYEWDSFTRTGVNYVYVNGFPIARIYQDLTVDYYIQDGAGNTRLVLDEVKQILFSTNYKPFGREFNTIGSETYRYAGEHYDSETGLVYFGARFYDPEHGRFISEDPVEGSLKITQTLNRYVYVLNNPLKLSDPDGMFLHILIGALVGMVVGMLIYTITTLATGGEWDWGAFALSGLIGAAVGAFAAATFGIGMAAFGIGGSAVGSWGAVGAGIATGAAVGAQTYFLSSTLNIAAGLMSPEDLSMEGFALSVGLGAGFGAGGGKTYNPKAYWRWPGSGKVPGPKVPRGKLVEVELKDWGLQAKGKPLSPAQVRQIHAQDPGRHFYGSRLSAWRAAGPKWILEDPHLANCPSGHVRFWHYHDHARTGHTHFFFGRGTVKA